MNPPPATSTMHRCLESSPNAKPYSLKTGIVPIRNVRDPSASPRKWELTLGLKELCPELPENLLGPCVHVFFGLTKPMEYREETLKAFSDRACCFPVAAPPSLHPFKNKGGTTPNVYSDADDTFCHWASDPSIGDAPADICSLSLNEP